MDFDFAELDVGNCRVYAIARPRLHGFSAGVVVKRLLGASRSAQIFRDEHVADDYLWEQADAALQVAIARGAEFAAMSDVEGNRGSPVQGR